MHAMTGQDVVRKAVGGMLFHKPTLAFSQVREKRDDGAVVSDTCRFWDDAQTVVTTYFVPWDKLEEEFIPADRARDTTDRMDRTRCSPVSIYWPHKMAPTLYHRFQPPPPKPDRITIPLTEREAELVLNLTNPYFGKQTGEVFGALYSLNIRIADDLDWSGIKIPQPYKYGGASTHASAERDCGEIRLTMDRDVAVTLRHLLYRLDQSGELRDVICKLLLAGARRDPGGPDRFTGTITWRKKRLKTRDWRPGKTYRLVLNSSAHDLGMGIASPPSEYEWEEA